MALRQNSIQQGAGSFVRSRWTRHRGLILGAVMMAVIALAWFDGGEEPLHPIVQDVAVPEGR